jgi:hypothetical protein
VCALSTRQEDTRSAVQLQRGRRAGLETSRRRIGSHLPSDAAVGSEEAEGWNGRRVLRSSTKFGATRSSVIRGRGAGEQLQLVSLAATYDAEGVHVAREHRARWSGVPPQLPSASATALSHFDRWTDTVDE